MHVLLRMKTLSTENILGVRHHSTLYQHILSASKKAKREMLANHLLNVSSHVVVLCWHYFTKICFRAHFLWSDNRHTGWDLVIFVASKHYRSKTVYESLVQNYVIKILNWNKSTILNNKWNFLNKNWNKYRNWRWFK